MSATAKTLGSLVVALIGLVVYLGIFIGTAFHLVPAFGYAVYLGLALTAVLFIVVLAITSVGIEEIVPE
jgi:hypothetical protein